MIADQKAALNRYNQEWPRWLREGIIDAAIPMAYSPNTTTVVRQLSAARSIPTERHLYAGIAVYNQGSRDAADKVRRARQLGVEGIALFSYDALAAKTGYARALKTWVFADPPRRSGWSGGRRRRHHRHLLRRGNEAAPAALGHRGRTRKGRCAVC